jgi:hypothetical protein
MSRIDVKACRMFPELAPLSDADCERLVAWLFAGHTSATVESWVLRLVSGGIVLGAWTAGSMCMVGGLLDELFWRYDSDWMWPIKAALVGLVLAPGGYAAGKAMDAARESVTAGLIRDVLFRPRARLDRCAVCDYPLDGLPRGGESIVCPECGKAADLRARSALEQVWRDGALDLSVRP